MQRCNDLHVAVRHQKHKKQLLSHPCDHGWNNQQKRNNNLNSSEIKLQIKDSYLISETKFGSYQKFNKEREPRLAGELEERFPQSGLVPGQVEKRGGEPPTARVPG